MKYFFSLLRLLFCVFSIFGFSSFASTEEIEKILAKINEAEEQKLPQTALELARDMEKKAKQEKQKGYYLRAITKRILNQAHILGKAPKEKVKILQEEMEKISSDVRPLVKIILARWFWHYYEQNRYKFSARTQTADLQSDDFTTWDLNKIFTEIRQLFEEGIKDSDYLKKEKLDDYKGLIEKDSLFPGATSTLYEFALREMLTFLASGISTLPSPEDKFEVDTNSDAFAHHKTFLSYKPQTTDKESPLLRAIAIYQSLLDYYQQKKLWEQYVDTDVARLKFIYAHVADSNKKESFLARLREIEKEFPSISTATMASFEIAAHHDTDQEYEMAVKVCDQAIKNHPKSEGAILCQNLVSNIKRPAFFVKNENSVNKSNAKFMLRYRNIKKIHFRIVQDDWKSYLEKKWRRIDDTLPRDEVAALLKHKALHEWSFDLPETRDFKEREIEIPLPDLSYGFYRIFASSHPQFETSDNDNREQLVYSSFWQTDTLILIRAQQKKISGMVLDARTGIPLGKRKISIYKRNNNKEGIHQKVDKVQSDENGLWQYSPEKSPDDWGMYFHVESKDTGDTLYTQWIYPQHLPEKISGTHIIFLTDRAIYRPGQRIHFKGICYKFDQNKDEYNVAECSDVSVSLNDGNGKELSRIIKSSNSFGSFSGDFLAPKNVLMGIMSLISSPFSGQSIIRVEEYKRPKFEITMNTPDKQYRLDDLVKVSGKALSYSGAALGSAKVKFRVIRGVRLPWWWYWTNPYANEQEITHGQTETDDSGEFTIGFKAIPNKAVNPKFNPFFSYRTEVDVVDSTGETRSSNITINVGYVSMQARPTVASWLPDNNDIKVEISMTTLDGSPANGQGTVEIHNLNAPKDVQRKPSSGQFYNWYWYWATETKGSVSNKDLSNIENWEIGKSIMKASFLAKNGSGIVNFKLEEGAYCAILKSQDQFGSQIEEKVFFTVFGTKDKNFLGISSEKSSFSVKVPTFFKVKDSSLEVGTELEAVLGTGYENGGAYISLIQYGKVLKSYWTKGKNQFNSIRVPITENLKGGFTLESVYVQENQIYYNSNFIHVERPEKKLKVSVETMRSTLRPGEKDTWTLKIEGHNGKKLASELAATMYDASLDTFASLSFPSFTGHWSDTQVSGHGSTQMLKNFITYSSWSSSRYIPARQYPHFTYDILDQFSYLFPYTYLSRGKSEMFAGAPAMKANMLEADAMSPPAAQEVSKSKKAESVAKEAAARKPEILVRSNLNETVFFYPHLISDADGIIKLEFTMPEALTRWKFMAMAHGRQTELGTVIKEIITQKELMVTPNPPRFLRQGDQLYFTSKIDNLSDQEQKGEIILQLINANNDLEVTKDFIKVKPEATFKFTIPAKRSQMFSWQLKVPDVTYSLIYKVKAIGDIFSDGEEGLLPILSRRIFVRESMPLWISGIGRKDFTFDKLVNSQKSTTLKSQQLVLQITSNPVWYAVQALPYLHKTFPECTDYVFERFFANSLGEKIVDSNPKIEKIFKQWSNTDSLKSNLQKDQTLKGLSLEETPWVNQAESEEKAKNDVAKFFAKNNLHQELGEAYKELETRMLGGGGWPWFSGGPIDYYTTLYLLTGFGKLRHLGVNIKMDLAQKSLANIDDWIKEIYDQIDHKELNNYTHLIAYYLYGRSFFLKDHPIDDRHKPAIEYFLKQSGKFWTELDSRLSEANTAIATLRFGKKDISDAIIKSLRQRALHSEELGMYWADEEWAYWWYRAPIEAQARIIELFYQVKKDEKEIDELNIWILKQKQTQDWKTSRATSEVIYTLLLAGSDLIKSDKLAEVTLGDEMIAPQDVEAGTGFYEKRFNANEIKATMGLVKIEKKDKGIAWGGLHWNYFEDISKITPHKTPLFLTKKIFVKRNTKKGPTLFSLAKEKIEVGETLVVRIELHSDRDMEYLHLKDMRGSGTEPVNVLSQWKYQDSMAYYESTRDTASHFFFAYLPKGNYVFEYDLKVFHKGEYQAGMAEIECMYAPEFNSHSESIPLKVD